MANNSTYTNSWIEAVTLDALQHDMQATDDELTYLQELVNLR